MSECEWIVLKYDVKPNEIVCQRCGAKAIAPMPCRLDDASNMMNAFYNNHKKCKEIKNGNI